MVNQILPSEVGQADLVLMEGVGRRYQSDLRQGGSPYINRFSLQYAAANGIAIPPELESVLEAGLHQLRKNFEFSRLVAESD